MDSLLLAQNSRILYSWRRTEGFFTRPLSLSITMVMIIIVIVISTIVIVLSIVVFCLETLPSVCEKSSDGDLLRKVLANLEIFCVSWFTVEIFLRLFSISSIVKFLKSPMNIVDLVAILPFFISLFLTSDEASVTVFAFLRVLRLVRVFRIFKLSRYSKAIQLLGMTLSASSRELILLTLFIMIILILFASGIYHLEADSEDIENDFKSIPHTFWMGIVTITTVGYGDLVPETLGKLIFYQLTYYGGGDLASSSGSSSIYFPLFPSIFTEVNQ